jgi:pimeloyl-ACP methyl ester carboxylesterase
MKNKYRLYMTRFFILYPFIVLLGMVASCSQKKTADFTDLETINKDDAFRSSIKTGNFIKLSKGYTYYEYENKDSDTLLVMVHGFSVPSYIWDSTYYAAIKRGYGVLRFDTYGRGYSDNPDLVYDVALSSHQLKELLDSLHVGTPVNLLGLSAGGRTITAFAARYPERIKNLIYVDAVGFDSTTNNPPKPALVSEEEISTYKRNRYPTMAKGQMSDFYDPVPFKGWDTKYEEMMQFKGFVRALISTSKNSASLENEHRKIAAAGIPVFAIWGEQDQVVRLEKARLNMLDRIPKIKLFVIGKAGHLPHMEQTTLFNSVVFDKIISGKR